MKAKTFDYKSEYGMALETAAAIGMVMGESEKNTVAYGRAGTASSMGGFVGFYVLAASAADLLMKMTKYEGLEAGVDFDWIDTTHNIANALLEFLIENRGAPDRDEQIKIISDSLTK